MGKRLYSLMMFFVVAILAGLLAAGLIVPIAGMATTTGTTMVQSLDSLPTELATPAPAERSRLLNADGSVLAYFYDENRIYETMDKISPIMQKAQVAIEDHRFYEHGAMDLQGTLRALVSTSQGNTQGGSSLTQQYVRLVQVEAAEANNDAEAKALATENTLARKIRELRYAIAMEKKFSKDEILERYLNIAYYGDGAYGVEAAAKHYFNTSAAKLDLAQSAMLAGLVRNPVATNPVKHPQLAIERRNNVLDRMLELKVITRAEADEAKAVKFDKSKVRDFRLGCANSKFPFVCDYALRTLLNTPSLGNTEEERKDLVYRGGLTIQTLIDPDAQKKAEKVIAKRIDPRDPVISVITMMQPGTGLIKAMAQSRPKMGTDIKKGQTFWNYAVGRSMGGAEGYQGGSTFKVFVAAAALEEGLGAQTIINARSHMNFKGKVFKSCTGSFKVNKDWNVDGGYGRINMWQGTKHSVNTYYVQLEQQVGLCAATKMAKKVGLKASNAEDIVKTYNNIPSFTLGIIDVTPLSMVEAYGTFAARGKHCSPIILRSIKNQDGKKFDVPSANCKQVVSTEVADGVNQVFRGAYNGGTATLAKVPGVDMAGKTGTVPNNKAVWTVGYTPDLVAAAVISFDSSPRYKKFWKSRGKRFLNGISLKYSKSYISGFSGREAGMYLLKPAFAAAMADIKDRHDFAKPDGSIFVGERVGIPNCAGMSLSGCSAALRRVGFSTYPTSSFSDLPAGTVIGTSPSGAASKYSSIGVIVSKGPKPEPQPTPTPSPSPTRRRGR